MRKGIVLAVVIVAVAAIIAAKLTGGNRQTVENSTAPVAAASPSASSQTAAQNKSTFYLVRDAEDQDAGCRRIYAFADQAENELAGRVEVKRPDVEKEKEIVDKYKVRVLPTILIVAPDGQVTERFEGEGGETVKQLQNLMTRLKTAE